MVSSEDFPKVPGIVKLSRVFEPNLRSKITPKVEFKDLGIRADLIRTIQPATYGSLWSFQEEPEGYNDPRSWPSFYRHEYWSVKVRRPCLKLTVEDLGEIKVEGDFSTLLIAINEEI
jgi:hypothetical protein